MGEVSCSGLVFDGDLSALVGVTATNNVNTTSQGGGTPILKGGRGYGDATHQSQKPARGCCSTLGEDISSSSHGVALSDGLP